MSRPSPYPVVEWRCRCCGALMQDGHTPDCPKAPPPKLACGSLMAHNAHGWDAPEGRRFCPGVSLRDSPLVQWECGVCGLVQNEPGECGYCAARARADSG